MDRAAEQRIEMDDFFSGFSIVRPPLADSEPEDGCSLSSEAGDAIAGIADEVSQCRRCELSVTRTNPVAGEGSCSAKIVFVGEAPGADEDAQGRPFVGRAGKLLDKIIAACGLSRREVFICNILKCRPPGNRDPKPKEVISCRSYLERQLAVIKPEVIVALGAHAARTLLDSDEAIGKLRGRFHEYYFDREQHPLKLMPTYHPSYLLRNYSPDNRRKVWEDIQKVMKEVGLPLPGND